jgi:hypothetical protein
MISASQHYTRRSSGGYRRPDSLSPLRLLRDGFPTTRFINSTSNHYVRQIMRQWAKSSPLVPEFEQVFPSLDSVSQAVLLRSLRAMEHKSSEDLAELDEACLVKRRRRTEISNEADHRLSQLIEPTRTMSQMTIQVMRCMP